MNKPLLTKSLGFSALSLGIVGSGCLLAHIIKSNISRYINEVEGKPNNYSVDLATVSNHIHSSIVEYEDKSFYEEELSQLICKEDYGASKANDQSDKKICKCNWEGLLSDHINGTSVEYIYYIKLKDQSNLKVTEQKPTQDNTGIYKGWKLNKFSWKKDGKTWRDWYGYCYPEDVGGKGISCKSSNLPEGWTASEV